MTATENETPMQAKVEVIDPQFAKQLLDQNCKNRPLSDHTVQRYAADMKAGRWNNNGQPIVLTPDGKLLDGQHRMAAIIRSQQTIAMMVVRGVPEENFVTMDSGRARGLNDVLAIEGYVNPQILSAVARASYNYASGLQMIAAPTKATLEEHVRAHPYMAEMVRQVALKPMRFPKSQLAAVLFLGNERRQLDQEVEDFIDGVSTGAGMFKGDARLTLREWHIAQRSKERGYLRSFTLFAATARAWNAYASGKELSMIKQIDLPNNRNLPIFGFNREDFTDVPNLYVKTETPRGRNVKAPDDGWFQAAR